MRALLTIVLILSSSVSYAAPRHVVRITGRQEVIVSGSEVRMEDISDIMTGVTEYQDTVIAINKIFIQKSPPAGESVTLSGVSIVETLKREKVDFESVVYTLPQSITIRRASRPLRDDEVRGAIAKSLQEEGRDIAFKGIEVVGSREVFPGEVTIIARPSQGEVRPGSIPFILTVETQEKERMELRARARLEEFVSLPVAKRSLPRGAVVAAEDIVMARLNVNGLPLDTTADPGRVVGLETSRQIIAGSAFQLSDLKMPPVVTNGSRVTMVYKSGALEATAFGTALQDGTMGEEIKVRNDQSKKIVRGKVDSAGVVSVK